MIHWLNKEDPNYSSSYWKTGSTFSYRWRLHLTKKVGIKRNLDLCLTNEEDWDDVKNNRCISDDFFNSNFGFTGKRCLHLNRGILLWKCVAI